MRAFRRVAAPVFILSLLVAMTCPVAGEDDEDSSLCIASQVESDIEVDWNDKELLERIVTACTREIAANPALNTRYIGRAEALNGLKRWREAISDFTKALELGSWMDNEILQDLKRDVTLRVLVGRGRAHAQIEDFESAAADFSGVLELDPDFAYALRARGYAHEKLGARDKAAADYRKVLSLEPNDEWTKQHLAEALCWPMFYRPDDDKSDRDGLERIVEACTLSLSAKPNSEALFMARANAHFALERWNEAISDYTTALGRVGMNANNPQDVKAVLTLNVLSRRGYAHEMLGEREKAAADYREALRLDPDNEWTKNQLTEVE